MADKSYRHLLAGSCSGLISCLLLQPFDLVKTRMQQGALNSSWKTTRIVIRESGVAGLWKGTMATILRNVPGSGMYFYSLHLLRSTMSSARINSDIVNLVGGVSARVSVGALLMPITVVKVRMESNHYNYKSIHQAIRHIVSQQGFRGLFSGLAATSLRDAPFAGVYVLCYENLKDLIEYESRLLRNSMAGIGGGLAATFVTQPFDILKTRIQLETRSLGFFKSVGLLYAEQGYKGFFVGMVPRLARKSLSSAISWILYEELLGNR